MVRYRRRERKIRNIKPSDMKSAVQEITKNGKSIRAVSRSTGITFSTLRRYVNKVKLTGNINSVVYEPNYSCRLVFNKEQETLLQEYLIKAAKVHYGFCSKEARKLAFQFAVINGVRCPDSWSARKIAGEDWFSYFMKRNPNLSLRCPETTSLSRATTFNRHNHNTSQFFNNFEEVMKKHNFAPNNIYNADETGCSTVQNVSKVEVVAKRSDKQIGKMTSGERGFLVTVLCAVSAAGNSIPPLMVFPRVNFKPHMMNGAPVGAIAACHPSGWITAEIFVSFLEHFIQVTNCTKDHPVLLLLDYHESRTSIAALDLARKNGVVMLTFPPNCSHKPQPLDRSVFGSFKTYYNDAANAYMITHPGSPITIYNIAQLVGVAYSSAFTPRNISSGFRVSGIWPINRSVLAEEYFSSYVTDRELPEELSMDCANAGQAEDGPSTSGQPLAGMVLHEEISPFPKTPRKKRGGTKVLTDTPVKALLEAEMLERSSKSMNKGKKIASLSTNQAKPKTAVVRNLIPSDSESENGNDKDLNFVQASSGGEENNFMEFGD